MSFAMVVLTGNEALIGIEVLILKKPTLKGGVFIRKGELIERKALNQLITVRLYTVTSLRILFTEILRSCYEIIPQPRHDSSVTLFPFSHTICKFLNFPKSLTFSRPLKVKKNTKEVNKLSVLWTFCTNSIKCTNSIAHSIALQKCPQNLPFAMLICSHSPNEWNVTTLKSPGASLACAY